MKRSYQYQEKGLVDPVLVDGTGTPIPGAQLNRQITTGGGGGGTPSAPPNSIQFNNGGAFGGIAPGSTGSVLTWNGTAWVSTVPTDSRAGAFFSGSALVASQTLPMQHPRPVAIPGTIFRATVEANTTETCTIEIWKKNGSSPTVADKISASAPLTLTAGTFVQITTFTGWTTSVAVGDYFAGNLLTASGAARQITFSLEWA